MKKSALDFLNKNKNKEIFINYILERFHENLPIEIEDISQKCFLSKSSITRYFKINGWTGFREFKFILYNELETFQGKKIPLNLNETGLILESIEQTSFINNEQMYDLAIEKLLQAKRIEIICFGSSTSVAWELLNRLNKLGLNASFYPDKNFTLSRCNHLTDKDVVCVISLSGENSDVINVTKLAQKAKATIIGFSKNRESNLSKLFDLHFGVVEKETLPFSFAFEPRICLYYVIVLLTLKLYKANLPLFSKSILFATEN